MAEFDLDEYFAKRDGAFSAIPTDAVEGEYLTPKQRQVAGAAAVKKAQLQQAADRQVEILKANRETAVAKLGMDTQEFPGSVLNVGAATVSDAVGAGGAVVGGVIDGAASVAEQFIDPADQTSLDRVLAAREAAQAVRDGTNFDEYVAINPETGERTSGIQRRLAADGALTVVQGSAAAVEGIVGLGSLVSGGAAGQMAEEAGFRPREAIETLEGYLSPEMQLANRKVEAAEGFEGTLDEALDNPSVIPQNIIKSVPSMIMGGAIGKGLTAGAGLSAGLAGAVGEGAIMAGTQAENIRQETDDGRLTLKQALLAAGTGVMGAGVGVIGNKIAKALKVGDVDEAVVAGAVEKSQRTLPSNMALAGAIEGGEELLQSSGEQVAQNVALDKQWDEGVGDAAAMGLITGAPMGAAVGAAQGAQQKAQAADAEAKQVAVFEDAVAKADPSPYLDAKDKTNYAPEKGVAVLFAASQKEDATPESKQANLVQAGKIVSDLAEQVEMQRQDVADRSPEGLAQLQATVTELQTKAAAAPQDTELQRQIEVYSGVIEDIKSAPAEELKQMQFALTGLEAKLTQAQELEGQLKVLVQPKPEELSAQVEQASQTPQAAESIITLAMNNPDALSKTDLDGLVSDTSNVLTENQRGYLRQFNAARVARNKMMDTNLVSQEVLVGNEKTWGIQRYQKAMSQALSQPKAEQAEQVIARLADFATSHVQKAVVTRQAYNQARDTGKPVQVIYADNQWQIAQSPVSEAEMTAGGFPTIREGKFSRPLVQAIQAEAKAIQATLGEFAAAKELKWAEPAVASQPTAAVEPVADRVTPVETTEATQTAAVTEQEESQPAAEVEVAPRATEVTGELAVFSTEPAAAVSGSNYQQVNIVRQFFRQAKDTEVSGLSRPLVATKNLMSQVWNREVSLKDFAPDSTLSTQQETALKTFSKASQAWNSAIKALLPAKNDRGYSYENPIEFFLNADGDIDENVKTAISVATFAWLNDHGRDLLGSRDHITRLMGWDSEAVINGTVFEKVGHLGQRESLVANDLGQTVLQVLGIKALASAPQNERARLEAGMGQFAIALMLNQGLVERQMITKGELDALGAKFGTESEASQDTEQAADASTKHYFLRVLPEGGTAVTPQQIMDASTGSQNVLDKVFATGRRPTEPSLTPPEFTQETTQNTDQPVPAELAEILNKLTKQPWGVLNDRVQVLKGLSDSVLNRLIGVVPVDEATVHKANRAGLKAKNDALLRDKDAALGYIEQMADANQDLYVQYSVWKHHRVGMLGNVLNPQTSKVHRFLMSMRDWETTIKPGDQAQVDEFMLQVGAGLGIKIDKQNKAKSLADTRALLESEDMQSALGALSRAIAGETLQDFEQEAIAQAVQLGGENLHSFASLMEVVKFDLAMAEGQPFKTSLMGEVDGVTNGPMLSQILFGTITQDVAEKGGFYQAGASATDYPTWRGQAGNQDYYETLAGRLTQNLIDGVDPLVLAPLFAVTGDLTVKVDRNIVKRPLTAVNYGSSMGAAIEGMADEFIEKLYSQIEALSKKPDTALAQEQLRDLLTQVSALLEREGQGKLDTTVSLADAMEAVLSPKQERALKNQFSTTIGVAMEDALKETLGDFIEARDQFNNFGRVAFDLYDAVYQHMRESYVTQAMESGAVATISKKNGDKDAIHELTAEQEAVIRKRLAFMEPVLATAVSSKGSKKAAGVRLSSTEKTLADTAAYSGQLKLGNTVPSAAGEKAVKTMRFRAFSRKQAGPGVSSVVNGVQSTDSAIISSVYADQAILNVHDAGGAGINKVGDMAVALNKSTFDNLLAYSPAGAMRDTLESVLTGLAQVMKDNADTDLPAKVRAVLEQAKVNSAAGLLESATAFAVTADTAKLQFLQQQASISQYGLAGHAYAVSTVDRQAAADALAAIPQAVTPKVAALLADLDAVLESKPAPAPVKVAEPQQSQWGELGNPGSSSQAELVSFFEQENLRPAKEVISALEPLLGTDLHGQYLSKLLKLIARVVDPDLPVEYVTKNTPFDGQDLSSMGDNYAGWFTNAKGNGDGKVFILGRDFKNSLITPEILMHELVHAAVVFETRDPSNSESHAHVQELENLLEWTAAKVNGDPALKAAFGAGVANVDELIAYGLTNKAFQDQVLSKVQVPNAQKLTTGFASAMQRFIKAVSGLLFKGKAMGQSTQAINGLNILVENASSLFAAAKARNVANEGKPKMVMAATALDPLANVNKLSSVELFDLLASAPAAFGAHLRAVQTTIADKLHGPFGTIKAGLMAQQATSVTDRFLKALDTGSLPFTSSAQASGFKMSQQEGFVLEQVEAVVKLSSDNTGSTTVAYRELAKLYEEARNKLKAQDFHEGDWTQATQVEKDLAQAKWDFLFTAVKGTDGKSDYLARFAALGLAHEPVAKLLQFGTAMDDRKLSGLGFWEKLQAVFERILETLHQKLTHTTAGQMADSKLLALVDQLVGIEAKRRAQVANQRNGLHDIVDAQTKKISDGVRDALQSTADSKFFKDSRSNVVKAIGAIGSTVFGDRLDFFVEGVQRLRDQQTKMRPGLVLGLFNEIRGSHTGNLTAHELLRASNNNERLRKQLITDTSNLVLGGYANGGQTLTKQDKEAITQVALRGDMQALLDHFSQADLETLLSDKKALAQAVQTFQAQLKKTPHYRFYLRSAKDLAYFMATGRNHTPNLLKNTQAIAELFGTKLLGTVKANDAKAAQTVLEPLVSLLALSYTSQASKAQMAQVMRAENARGNDSGVQLTLRMHRELQQQARERLFSGSEALMLKGYVPEVFNPHVTVVAANAKNGLQLERMGYSKSDQALEQDAADPYAEATHLYRLEDGGLKAYVTGIFSTTGAHAKGSTVHSGEFDMQGQTLHAANQRHSALIARRKAAAVQALFTTDESYNPAKAQGNHLAPVFNAMGNAVNYAYLMNHATKDTLLERNNSFEELLGKFAGSTFDKQASRELNAEAVKALHQQYSEEYAKRPENYLMVGPGSPDVSLREAYKLLPESTKQSIQDTWGSPNMLVRSDLLDMNFGYRKFSLTDSFSKKAKGTGQGSDVERNLLESMFVDFWSYILADRGAESVPYQTEEGRAAAEARAALKLRKAEDIWQEIVSEIKDILVVKSGITLLGNVLSNISELVWIGVPLTYIVKHHRIALRGVVAYRKDAKELYKLQQLLKTGTIQGSTAAMEQRIVQLEDGLSRNPVKELIDAGLLPTIVEDVAQDNDEFSYKSKLVRSTEKYTSQLNKHVRTAGRTLYMAHDTPLYQLMSQGTQLSDFVARYTAYQYMIGRKRAPMAKTEAVQFVADAFVNYDIPTHRSMQYLNDMGIIWFTKYYLRIQKVIMHLWRDNPARALMILGIDQYFSGAQTLMDSGFMNHIGNPLSVGALKYPGTLDELATVNALMYPFAGE